MLSACLFLKFSFFFPVVNSSFKNLKKFLQLK